MEISLTNYVTNYVGDDPYDFICCHEMEITNKAHMYHAFGISNLPC